MNKLSVLVILFIGILTFSCSSEDSIPELITTDFLKTIDENQLNNTEIGKVEASSNDGKLSYQIVSQSPLGSLDIDSSSGVLTVADETTFDYETNPTISATIEISSSNLTKTLNVLLTLSDISDLEFFLTDSKASYIAAENNEWVFITENEYSILQNKLNYVSVHGSTDSEFNIDNETQISSTDEFTIANINQETTIPNQSYIFAFKYEIKGDNITGTQIKQSSTSNFSGFINVGNPLPVHSSNSSKIFYFVIKNNQSQTTDTGYIALYKPDNSYLSFKRQSGTYYWSSFNVDNLNDDDYGSTGADGIRWLYQGLSTTQKQW